MTTIQDRIINANISIQKVAYEMANARDKAFKAGEIKDGKTTDEWNEYRKAKVKLSQVISQSIKEAEEETRKEITDDLGKLMDIDRARKLGDNLEIYQGKRECPICGANPEKQREMILSIINKKQK